MNQTGTNSPVTQNCLAVLGLLIGIAGLVVAVLNWLSPFSPVGSSPFEPPQPTATVFYSPVRTSSENVTVLANRPWQDTGIMANPGDILIFEYVSGFWRWTGDRPDFDGNGDPYLTGTYLDICTTIYDCPITDAQLSALVGKIGISGTPFLIGNGITYTVPNNIGNNQELFLMGNDSLSGLHDNVGSIEVTVSK